MYGAQRAVVLLESLSASSSGEMAELAEGARLLSEYTPKAYLGFESPSLRQMPFLSPAFPSCFHSVLCGAYVAVPRFTFVLREKNGSATTLVRLAAKAWQCHNSHAHCAPSVAVPRFPCTVGKALVLKFSHRSKNGEEGRSHALLGRARLQGDDGGKLPT